MGKVALMEKSLVKDIFDQKKDRTETQIILVDLKKIEKVLNSLNTDSFRKDLYPGFFTNEEPENSYGETSKKIVKESHLKKLISIFGEKKFSLCRNTPHEALTYLFTNNNYKNNGKVKAKILKLFNLSPDSNSTLGTFCINSNGEKNKFFGWLTKKEVEENFMKILEELADLHECFNLEKTGSMSPELTFSLLDYIEGGDWKYQELKEIAAQFEEIIKNLFCAFRRAHQYCLDIVIMEEEPW